MTPSFLKEIAPLVKKHEMIAICVRDPLERVFPSAGLVRVVDREYWEIIYSRQHVRKLLEQMKTHTAQNLAGLESKLKQMGIRLDFR